MEIYPIGSIAIIAGGCRSQAPFHRVFAVAVAVAITA